MSVTLGGRNHNVSSVSISASKVVTPAYSISCREDFVETLANLISLYESKFSFWRNHSEIVTRTAIQVAREMNFKKDFIRDLHDAGRLHDLGKILLSEKILSKEESLTERDWCFVKLHPYWGKMILDSLGQLKSILPLIYYHHELYDGSGYPDGIKGETIPLGARIITLADTFAIMSVKASLYSNSSGESVIAEIKEKKGIHLDPVVVDAFLRINFKEFTKNT